MLNSQTSPAAVSTYIVRFTDNADVEGSKSFTDRDEAVAFSNGCDDRGFRNVTVRRVGENSRIIIGLR